MDYYEEKINVERNIHYKHDIFTHRWSIPMNLRQSLEKVYSLGMNLQFCLEMSLSYFFMKSKCNIFAVKNMPNLDSMKKYERLISKQNWRFMPKL